jgi:hypothetical protein
MEFKKGDVVRVAPRPNPMAKGHELAGYRGTVVRVNEHQQYVEIREFETMAFRAAPLEFVSFGSGRTKVEKDALAAKGKEARETAAQCACGCEGLTKGGGFIPGHDAKLSARFKRIMKGKGLPEDLAALKNPRVIEHPRVRSSAYLMFHLEHALKAVETGQFMAAPEAPLAKKAKLPKPAKADDGRGVPMSKAKPKAVKKMVNLPCENCNMKIIPHDHEDGVFTCTNCGEINMGTE